MNKIFQGLLAAVVLLLVSGLILYNTRMVQDWLLDRLAGSQLAAVDNQDQDDVLRVVVCGSASPLGQDSSRAQACIAVMTPDHLYLIDAGAGSATRLRQARLPLQRLRGVLLTHYHSDHIADLPGVNLSSWVAGRPEPLMVSGPDGINGVIDGLNMAYELDRRYRVAHHGADLLPPELGLMRPEVISAPSIWSDGDLVISAFAVDHSPVSPAVGYRFDYRGRSVAISGDSVVADSLFGVVEKVDLLFHDALSADLLNILIANAQAAGRDRLAQIMTDVLDYHAEVASLESRALQAGVRQLVLYHLVPVPVNSLMLKIFSRDLESDTLIAEDLMVFELPVGSSEIRVSKP